MSRINPDEGLIRYTALMDAGEYREAMEYADSKADEHSVAADIWLNRAGQANLDMVQAEKALPG